MCFILYKFSIQETIKPSKCAADDNETKKKTIFFFFFSLYYVGHICCDRLCHCLLCLGPIHYGPTDTKKFIKKNKV